MKKYLFVLVVLITGLSYFSHEFFTRSPNITSTKSDFSALRAMDILQSNLAQGVPHPVGSQANKLVKQNILDWFEQEGISAQVQSDWGCRADTGQCAWVENIIAIVPGRTEGPYVALMAHYDSVASSVGGGDDGAGVASVMEVARLLSNTRHKNPIVVILTDAEEKGLLGAEAFFEHHPLAASIGVILNLEGAGSKGRSLLLRTSMENNLLVSNFVSVTQHPFGGSLFNEIFKRMSNDTDFTIASERGIPGTEFVFAGERNHYHTANDSIENLDLASLQHHGENLLPMARFLANADLNVRGNEYVLFGNAYGFWLQWPRSMNFGLLVFALTLLVGTTLKSKPNFRQLLVMSALPIGVVIGVALSLATVFYLLNLINGATPFWPANDLPYRGVLFATPVLTILFMARWANERFDLETGLLGAWWFMLVVGLIFAILLPDAANIIIFPLLWASVLLFISRFLTSPISIFASLLTIIGLVPFSLSLVLLLEQSQGYWLILASVPFFSIYMVGVLPLIRGRFVNGAIWASSALLIVSFVSAITLPLYTASRPQYLNFRLMQDDDKNIAWLEAFSANPLPLRILSLAEFSEVSNLYPWSTNSKRTVVAAEFSLGAGPTILVQNIQATELGRDVSIRVTNPGKADMVRLQFLGETAPSAYILDGVAYDLKPQNLNLSFKNRNISFWGIQNKNVDVTLIFKHSNPVDYWLVDQRSGLAAQFADLVAARAPNATQVHFGDAFRTYHMERIN